MSQQGQQQHKQAVHLPKKKSRGLRTTFYFAICSAIYTGYQDYIRRTPNPEPHFTAFKEKEQRKVVVLGGGLVGLATAYYLSQNKKNQVNVIGQRHHILDIDNDHGKWASTPFIAPALSQPMTNISLMQAFMGFKRVDSSNSVTLKELIRIPGVWRFLRFWLSPFKPSIAQVTDDLKSAQVQNQGLLEELISLGILKPSVLREQKLFEFGVLNQIDTKKQFEEVKAKNKELYELLGQVPVFGKQELNEAMFSKFPNFEGVQKKYNMALQSKSYFFDTHEVQKQLYDYLQKQENVQFENDCELTEVQKHKSNPGSVAMLHFGHGGLRRKKFACDALVVCTGWQASRILKDHLSYSIPVIPLKQYSLICQSSVADNGFCLYAKDKGVFATQIAGSANASSWLMQGFADLSYTRFQDERRVRIFKNNLCLLYDKKEVLAYTNLQMNMLSATPDDYPMVGNLRQHPNVFVNVGHGQRVSSSAFITGKVLSERIDGGEASSAVGKKMDPSRFII